LTERKINTKTVKRINIKIMRQTIARTMKMKREREGTETGKVQGKRTNFGLRKKENAYLSCTNFRAFHSTEEQDLLKDFFIQPMS
jgi:hypothetical protein